jgi:hypothetical protein
MNRHLLLDKKRFFALFIFSFFTLLSLMMAACATNSISTGNSGDYTFTLIDRANSVSVPAGHDVTVTATCHQGEKVISGGFSLSPTDLTYTLANNTQSSRPFVALKASYPSGPGVWSVEVQNRSSGENSGSVLVIAHAVCSPSAVFTQIIPGTQQISGNQAIPLGDNGPWTVASCPGNTVLLGGGFQVPAFYNPDFPGYPVVSDAYLADTTSLVPTGWKVKTNGASTGITAYAVCTVSKFLINPKLKSLNLYSTVSGYQGLGAAPILTPSNEYTFSANGSDTCGKNTIETSSGFVVPHNQQLANNTYNFNQFDYSTLVGTHIPNYSASSQGEWDTRFTIYDPTWYTTNTGGWQPGTYNHYQSYSLYVRSICVQVILPNTPTPTLAPTDTATPVATDTPAVTPTDTPVPTSTPSGGAPPPPTATPKPAAPLCTPLNSGTQTLNVDNSYLNLLTGAISMSSGVAHLFWTSGPTGEFAIAPINGAQTASTSGVTFSSITCSQIKQAHYGSSDISAGSMLFLVKISNADYAKVQMRYAVGSAEVTLQWQTYKVS